MSVGEGTSWIYLQSFPNVCRLHERQHTAPMSPNSGAAPINAAIVFAKAWQTTPRDTFCPGKAVSNDAGVLDQRKWLVCPSIQYWEAEVRGLHRRFSLCTALSGMWDLIENPNSEPANSGPFLYCIKPFPLQYSKMWERVSASWITFGL